MYLGIDIGTSGVKAVVIDDAGSVVRQETVPLPISRPHPTWSEQQADDWVTATEAAVLALPADERRTVRGIGLTGQMHGATLLGADDRPLRPAILWNDGRSAAQCRALEAAEPRSRAITGNIAMPGFTAPKLLWVRDAEPAVFAATRTVLLPKDYVRLALTGEKASDLSDSAGTLWLDVGARDWSDAMLAACGLDRSAMPTLFEGSEVAGTLRPEVAARWGMAAVPVVAGGGDNAAGAIGVGVIDDGDALLSLGTSGVTFVATRDFRANPARGVHSFCHALPDTWHQMSVHLSAASCLDWAARLAGLAVPDLLARAETIAPGRTPVLFLPYLSGERTPHNDPDVRGALIGLDHDSDAAHLAAAVLEGVAFAHADGLDALREAGTRIARLRVIGGGARSRHWGTILAATLGVPLDYLAGAEVGPALGAARLAQLGAGGGSIAAVCRAPDTLFSIDPDPALADRLAARRAHFQAAYPAITAITGARP